MKKIKNLILFLGITLFTVSPISPLLITTYANGNDASVSDNVLCDIFPFLEKIDAFGVKNICFKAESVISRSDLTSRTLDLLRLGASLIFVGIIVIAVYIIIKAAIKYIRSEGDDKKIEEAQKAIKSVFIGLIALFIGIIGLVLILVLFEATGIFNQVPNTPTITDPIQNVDK